MALPKISTLRTHERSGFTLVEILIVTALLASLGGLAVVVSMATYRSYTFLSEQDLLISLLQKARSQSLNNLNQAPHGVYLDMDAYTLFEGSNYARRDQAQDLSFSRNSNYFLNGLTEIVFAQISATTTSGEIILDDHIHPKATISLNYEGQINLH